MMETQFTSAELIVCETLLAATNHDPCILRKAEAQLNEWETQPGFFTTLTRLCLSSAINNVEQHLDMNVRWMAAVYLKNGINRHWKRGTELSTEEKHEIRDLLLRYFVKEPVQQVFLQIVMLISRIARIDCPTEWPQLLPELLHRLETIGKESFTPIESGEQERILLTFHHIVKALASRRMIADRKIFEELTNHIYEFILKLWDNQMNLFFYQLKTNQNESESTIKREILCARILRKLVIYGIPKQKSSDLCLGFMENLLERTKQCLICRYEYRQLSVDVQLVTLLEKLILKQMKTVLEFKDMHYIAFEKLTLVALNFAFDHVFDYSAYLIFTDNVIDFPQFAIHCMNLIKSIIPFSTYVDSISETYATLEQFFTEERISYICEKLITHYFLLTQYELEMWLKDPEDFDQDDTGGDNWKYALRPCVELLFLELFTNYQKEMVTQVTKYIQKAQEIQLSPNVELKTILLKDAIYNAAGLAAFYLFKTIDFDTWFKGQLLDELKINTDNFRILRRRIIWLLRKWISVKFSNDLRPLAYEACLHLLSCTEDMLIRLTAACTLSVLINDLGFTSMQFLPYLEQSFYSLFTLLREAKEWDTKMKILAIISSLIEKMNDNIEPHVDKLISYLPILWDESEKFSMLRCVIICVLKQMVQNICDIPDKVTNFLYSVIALSTDVNEPSHIYLIEDGISLWLAVIKNSTNISVPIINLCRNIIPILEMSPEHLRKVLILIQAYILLDVYTFMDNYGCAFVEFCKRIITDMPSEDIILIIGVLEMCLKLGANHSLELIRPILPYFFRQVYSNKEFSFLDIMNLTLISRVLLINQGVFKDVIQELQCPYALENILDVWISKMSLVQDMEKRKLFCLAFLSIFSNDRILLERIPAILRNISETLTEVMIITNENDIINDDEQKNNNNNEEKYSKYCDRFVIPDDDDRNNLSVNDSGYKVIPHYDRCYQLLYKDPVLKVSLPDCVRWHLNQLQIALGNNNFQQLMSSVDSDVLKTFNEYFPLQLMMAIN